MLKRLWGRVMCGLWGHQRGRRVVSVFDARTGKQITTFACPRCGRLTVYREKVQG